jgi:hypothetical protein
MTGAGVYVTFREAGTVLARRGEAVVGDAGSVRGRCGLLKNEFRLLADSDGLARATRGLSEGNLLELGRKTLDGIDAYTVGRGRVV